MYGLKVLSFSSFLPRRRELAGSINLIRSVVCHARLPNIDNKARGQGTFVQLNDGRLPAGPLPSILCNCSTRTRVLPLAYIIGRTNQNSSLDHIIHKMLFLSQLRFYSAVTAATKLKLTHDLIADQQDLELTLLATFMTIS